MKKISKKLLAFCLSVLMLSPFILSCQSTLEPHTPPETAEDPAPTKETVETEISEEDSVLKILTLGHSLAVDSCHMLNLIFETEGLGDYEAVEIATLYYSGCPIPTHLEFALNDSDKYYLYTSTTDASGDPPTIEDNVVMRDVLSGTYWDVIVMQGGVFEIAEDHKYTDGKLDSLVAFAKRNSQNRKPIIAWHMPWATPTDNDLRDKYPGEKNTYYTNYEKYGQDRSTFYKAICDCVKKNIVPHSSFKFVIPSGTAMENALSSSLTEKDLHRDYAHATDLGRVIAAYT